MPRVRVERVGAAQHASLPHARQYTPQHRYTVNPPRAEGTRSVLDVYCMNMDVWYVRVLRAGALLERAQR